MSTSESRDRYVVISSDCHAGAPHDVYRSYLESRYDEPYDAWREQFVNPFADLADTESEQYRRNYEFDLRQHDLEGEGVVGEVIFPNTIPPFFPGSPLVLPDPQDSELELRWAGIRAHNRWLADFCAELPGRRAGVAQVLLNDIDQAVEEIKWVKESGLFGGILIPNVAPDSPLPQLHAPSYEPVWTICEELEVPVNTHGGTGVPYLGDHPSSMLQMYVDFGFYAHRPLIRLMMSGVFERHPRLKFVMTEQGNSWIGDMKRGLDWVLYRLRNYPDSVEARIAGPSVEALSKTPSEYWEQNCFLGASFMGPADCGVRYDTGVHKIMWGGDYPHSEGTFPYTLEALRFTFAGVAIDEVRQMLGRNAAEVYGFDWAALSKVAADIGPTVADVDEPLPIEELPETVSLSLSPVQKPVGCAL
jgi:predicted TIM-barrel fold metal-dependent hydrolase